MTECGDCGEIYLVGEAHRCASTTGQYMDAIRSFVKQTRVVAELERKLRAALDQVAELEAENARLRGDLVVEELAP